MPVNSAPLLIAALDAGSNAIRAVVARASSATEIRELANARWTVRLGHGVFTRRRLDSRTMSRAVETFVQFRNMLDRYGVAEYSAVATSAVREAANRDALISRILREAGIELTAISPAEEARLVREAVFAAAGGRFAPRAIIDLGGGSLEISFLRGRKVERALALPLGTVRLMEMFDQAGSFTPESFARLRRYIMSMLRSHGRAVSTVGRAAVVACGGNAEALARLAAGPRVAGFNTLSLQHLAERLWGILGLGVEERMESLGVRRDRAEVIGVAAVVFNTLGEWLGARQMVVPGVGVREGILHDLAAAHFGPATAHDERAEGLRQQARRFAARMHSDAAHCEHVRRLAAQLFDQLAPVHGLPPSQRVPLELGALLHEAGFAVNARELPQARRIPGAQRGHPGSGPPSAGAGGLPGALSGGSFAETTPPPLRFPPAGRARSRQAISGTAAYRCGTRPPRYPNRAAHRDPRARQNDLAARGRSARCTCRFP